MSNRLASEKSPYLLQHAQNPVDWYPWGEEAFNRAKEENKPVFLSIGYSTCHWCHVMERESFEDAEVAALLNEGFVAVKVDREERPDIDHVYMAVCQALTGQGGWPLTVFLTPDKKPFFAGTYFPKHGRYGRPGLMQVLKLIREKWPAGRPELERSGAEILKAIASEVAVDQTGEPEARILERGFDQLKSRYDPVYGGFGEAPKFPSPHQLLFLLRYWKRRGEPAALEMVEKTLQAMYCGGIYDHTGFGFARYSTDRRWLVPHFEKMLYDNALLALAFLEARQATGNGAYGRVAREIFTYVWREMTAPEGGFYSARDADSEGVEGKFYLWTPGEVKAVLGESEGELFCRHFDITAAGNFDGGSIPNRTGREGEVFAGMLDPETAGRLESAREKLYAAREKRVHPHRDDKILTAWNGLCIAALAVGARVLGEPDYAAAAGRAAAFIRERLRDAGGRLLARYRDGQAAFPAYLDDYAFYTWGLIELYQATFEPDYLKQALELTRQMQELFRDEKGGFFFTGRDAEELPARPKEIYDGATPSGNSVAALNLLRLARLTGDAGLEEAATEQMRAFAGAVAGYPAGHTFFLCALDFALGPATEIVLAGERGAADTQALLQVLRSAYLPEAVLALRPAGEEGERVVELIPHVAGHAPVDGKAAAYLCRNFACQAPVTDSGELAARLKTLKN
ncbi:thioredoxin domain-containing protein [Desulfotomaculum copahuensis]|uniref:Thioredoxin n=1 Tax=Desulfotomaculum copahuensis TaxID=1838280 RepID=A0A1B7LKP3_9FIRM|nr:thioredoxin domain-containing protein [Desulfotomaculum copahuensis]OAT87144.1 thioredoxin [Desulfotomaculum copahuensis]